TSSSCSLPCGCAPPAWLPLLTSTPVFRARGCRVESGVVYHPVVLRWGHEQRCDHHHPSVVGPPRRRPDLRRRRPAGPHLPRVDRSEEHTSELQSRFELVCRLLLEHTQAES